MRLTIAEMRRSSRAGFTLIELLVVLAILALLVGIATPQVLKYLAKAKEDANRIQIEELNTTIEQYYVDVGRYPSQQEGLQALIVNPGLNSWHGPYLKGKIMPSDPWGQPYQYRIPGQSGDYDLFSLGSKGANTGPNK